MKKLNLLIIIAVLLMSGSLFAASEKDAEKVIEKAVDFTLSNGLKVIFLPAVENEVVSMHIVIPGTSFRQSMNNSGIEEMLLEAMTKGSKHYPKTELDRALDKIGSAFGKSAGMDSSTFRLLSIKPYFKQTLQMFADAFKNPLLNETEIELIKKRMIASVKSQKDNPDSYLSLMLNRAFYQNHPYANAVAKSEETLSQITLEALKAYHSSLIKLSSSFIVVVGKLEQKELVIWLENAFGDLKRTESPELKQPEFTKYLAGTIVIPKDMPTKYILGKFAAPSKNHPDYGSLMLTMEILSARLWKEVRTKRGLAYAVSARIGSSMTNYGYLYISTTDEDQAMPVIFAEIEKLKNTPVKKDEFNAAKAVFETRYFMSQESNVSQAALLGAGELYLGDYKQRNKLIQGLMDASIEQIMMVAKKYLKAYTFAILGKENKINVNVFPLELSENEETNKENNNEKQK